MTKSSAPERRGRCISWRKDRLKWTAYVYVDGKKKFLGNHRFEQDALDAVAREMGELPEPEPVPPMTLDEYELIEPDIGPDYEWRAEWLQTQRELEQEAAGWVPPPPIDYSAPKKNSVLPPPVDSLTSLTIW